MAGVGGCGAPGTGAAPPAGHSLEVTVRTGTIAAPDSVPAGWTRLRVVEDGAGHIVVVFRLADTTSEASAFLAELDTARATPAAGLALGGPEIGDSGEVIVDLTPGRYLLGCVRRGEDGRRHASAGESRLLIVTPRRSGEATPAPAATLHVGMTEFAFTGVDQWPSGSQLLRVENTGEQDHQLRLERFKPGRTLEEWLNADDPDQLVTPVAGVARMGPGTVAYLPLELEPGDYLLYCLIPDRATGHLHVGMGMMRAMRVRAEAASP